MKKKILYFIAEHEIMVRIVAFALIIVLIFTVAGVHDKNVWNEGRCSCGGAWKYVGSEQRLDSNSDGRIYTTTFFIYQCDSCGKMHEFYKLR